ncbi:MAG TPA: transcription termination/antitermination protein NusA [Clostridiales bacterium]|jgi:N utilization substance protein A|nr:transcription termination/antitermination protein NusA [Clostridiales bacterium]
MTNTNKDFFTALDALETERRLDKELLIASLESGLASAYKKEYGEPRAVKVNLNPEKFLIKFMAYQTVVEGEPENETQISLEDAKKIKEKAEVGDIIGEDVTPKKLSRIAAQTAKQVIMQRINEAVREQIAAEMNEKEGELVSAIIRRIDNNIVFVEIMGSQMEGVMATNDQIFGEKYEVGDRIKVFVKRVKDSPRGTQVIVSRSCAGFVKKLFELEVPEIRSGLVRIKNAVREAGHRTKISVYSEDPNLDALAACVGQKGVRVNAIVAELNGEKVDIILYTPNLTDYIARSLSPAKPIMVKLSEDEKHADVIVNDDKLSLAIGKGGMNARLAARLTGVKIDIKTLSDVTEMDFDDDENDETGDDEQEI